MMGILKTKLFYEVKYGVRLIVFNHSCMKYLLSLTKFFFFNDKVRWPMLK